MLPQPLVVFFVFCLGLAVGSFLNVVIYRLPQDRSLIRPGSRCRHCGFSLPWYDNIPLLSYMLLRGRCRRCKGRISPQYPLVELTTGLFFAANFLALGWSGRFVAAVTFCSLLLAIALTDARTYLIPDELSIGGTVLGILISFFKDTIPFPEAVIGSVFAGGFFFVIGWAGSKLFQKEALGGGDVKMMAMIGAFVGWQGALLTIFLGSLLGTLVFGPISFKTKRLVPYGLFLALGGLLAFYLGPTLLGWYFGRMTKVE